MSMILLNGTQALNLNQIVSAEYAPSRDIGKDHFKSWLKIITMALELETVEYDYSTFHAVGGSRSQVITLTGNEADSMWRYIVALSDR